MDKKLDDQMDPKAKGKKTAQADFDRNRDGLYGGLPKARDKAAPVIARAGGERQK